MVTVSVLGGLGNQMFQYAAARALAQRHGVDVIIDDGEFQDYPLRKFLLDRLRVPEALECRRDPSRRRGLVAAVRWRDRFDRLAMRFGLGRLPQLPATYSEPHFQFDPAFFDQGPAVVLLGFFQSERYFAEIADQLRAFFQPREALGPTAQSVAALIAGSSLPVSVHIRRGDYVTSAVTADVHGVLGPAYYRKALSLLQDALAAPMTVFVFSDDPGAAEETLAFLPQEQLVHVRGDPDRPWEDLALMATCSHHVIANSSFSWWGAWLNPSQDKVVIAPRRWFSPTALRRYNTCDLYPDGWILV